MDEEEVLNREIERRIAVEEKLGEAESRIRALETELAEQKAALAEAKKDSERLDHFEERYIGLLDVYVGENNERGYGLHAVTGEHTLFGSLRMVIDAADAAIDAARAVEESK